MKRSTFLVGRAAPALTPFAFAFALVLTAAACSDGTGPGERTPFGSWVRESHMGQPFADSLRVEQTGPGLLRGYFHNRISPRFSTTLTGTYDGSRLVFSIGGFIPDAAHVATMHPGGDVLELVPYGNVPQPPIRYRRAAARQTPIVGTAYEYSVTLPDGTRREYSGVRSSYFSYVMGPTSEDYATSIALADSLEFFLTHPGQPLAPTGAMSGELGNAVLLHGGVYYVQLDRAASEFFVESSTQDKLRARFRVVLTNPDASVPRLTVEGSFTALRIYRDP